MNAMVKEMWIREAEALVDAAIEVVRRSAYRPGIGEGIPRPQVLRDNEALVCALVGAMAGRKALVPQSGDYD